MHEKGRLKPVLLLALALALGGCATKGPLHVYTLDAPDAAAIGDSGGTDARSVPSFLEPGDRVTGFAYDPFTDHFFLRLAPGNQIRVVDRPARAIKREFTVAELPTMGGGDLAVRPRSGHLYFVHPGEPALIETSRLCEFIRRIPLRDLATPPAGAAYDAERDQLLTLSDGPGAGAKMLVTRRALDGTKIGEVALARRARGPLAFDAEARELYVRAPEPDAGFLVFDEQGKFLRILSPAARVEFLDVGPRSFLRVF